MIALRNTIKKLLAFNIALAIVILTAASPAFAHRRYDDDGGMSSDTKNVIKQGAIGAGLGAILGGVSREGSAVKGAGIGALSGAGTGVIDNADSLQGRPIIRNAAKGAVVGAGVSGATNGSLIKGAAVGAGAGAGYQLLRDYLDDRDHNRRW